MHHFDDFWYLKYLYTLFVNLNFILQLSILGRFGLRAASSGCLLDELEILNFQHRSEVDDNAVYSTF